MDITHDLVERRHASFGKRSQARANNAMRVLRALFNFAAGKYEDADGRPIILDNPISGGRGLAVCFSGIITIAESLDIPAYALAAAEP